MLQDVREAARLVDALSDIDTYESAVHPGDVPEATASLYKWEAAIHNTGKPVGTEATSAYDCKKLIELATVVAGGEDEFRRRPLIGFGVCPVSPLKLPRDATEVIIESARACGARTPFAAAWRCPAGSSPVTLAGTLVLHNAEVLSGIVLAQFVERGCPVTYGSSTTAMDLKLAAACVGSPELALFSAACAPDRAQIPAPRVSWRGCRRTPSSVTRRPVTRRPSPDSFLRWQVPTRSRAR